MFFNFDGGHRREVIRYLDLHLIENSGDIVNHTFPLLPYSGGNRTLQRPVLFVHGLDVAYDETWGVKRPDCYPQNINIDGALPQHLLVKTESGSNTWTAHAQVSLGFDGNCLESGKQVQWQSGPVDLFSYSLALYLGSQISKSWDSTWKSSPPTIDGLSVTNGMVNGVLHTWILASDTSRSLPAGTPYSIKSYDASTIRTLVKAKTLQNGDTISRDTFALVRANLPFSVSMSGLSWNHQAKANARLPDTAKVDPDTSATRSYGSATAPDIISRIQRLKKGEDINNNGLYFFNGYRWKADADTGVGADVQPLPWWTNAGPESPGEPGESWALYKDIVRVLNAHYGTSWTTDTSLKIDVVAHSQGGITTREMLAHAGGTDPYGNAMPTGAANAANHIRRLVTVDTPHFGSVFTTSPQSIPDDYANSQKKLVQDSAKFDLNLADITISTSLVGDNAAAYAAYYDKKESMSGYAIQELCKNGSFTAATVSDVVSSGMAVTPVWASLAIAFDATTATNGGIDLVYSPDLQFKMTGNWFWAKSVAVTRKYVMGGFSVSSTLDEFNIDKDIAYNRTFTGRKKGAHLAIDSLDIRRLSGSYPTLPNGQDLDLQTLHSTVGGLGTIVTGVLGQALDGICDLNSDLRTAKCYAFGNAFGTIWWNQTLDLPMASFLKDYNDGWLAKSDISVQDGSQQAVMAGNVWHPIDHPGLFHEPRPYAVRRFLTGGKFPDSLVPHGGNLAYHFDTTILGQRLRGNSDIIGAPLLGHDIYCALAPDCSDLLDSLTGQVVRLPWDNQDSVASQAPDTMGAKAMRKATVPVTGNFQYSVLAKDTSLLGLSVAVPGATSPLLRVLWSPGSGVVVEHSDSVVRLVPAGYASTPRVVRTGDSLAVLATFWSGKQLSYGFQVANLSSTLQVAAQRPAGLDEAPLLVGKGTVDSVYLNPKPNRQVRVWFREARSDQTAWSKPRFVIENNGRTPITGITARYRFRADPANPPVLTAPSGNLWRIEAQGGDLYDLVLSDPQVVIPVGGTWPSSDQIQVGLHMSDWTLWDVYKDPSNDRNYGQPQLNETIRVWDATGTLLYGRDVGAADPDRPLVRRVLVATREAAVGENNVSKPEIEIRNDGNEPIQGLTATWYTRLPQGKTPVLDPWYTSEARISLQSLGGGLWAVQVKLSRWLQPGQKAVSGSFGIHLPDWAAWDRNQAPSHLGVDGHWSVNPWVVVTDSAGAVIWGNLPRPQDIPVTVDTDTTTTGTTDSSTTKSAPNLLVELRDESPSETNIVKPRVRATNQGTSVINSFRLEFPVHPERNLVPVLESYWVPYCQTSVETRATETTAILDCSGLSLAAGATWPDATGAVFGLHYSDWSTWDRTDDSAFAIFETSFAAAPNVRVLPLGGQ